MPFIRIAGFLLSALAVSVSAHGHVNRVMSNGVWHAYHPDEKATAPGWWAKNPDNGFVDPTKFADADIICHNDATPGHGSIPVTAGESISIQWNFWHVTHHGPVLGYLAPVHGEFADVDKTALQFFKIDEAGLKDGSTLPGYWATDDILKNNLTWSLTIPASIAPGKYVLRHELISLQQAYHANGAQNYPQCFNVVVTSNGTDTPAGEPATSFYKSNDTAFIHSIYRAPLNYTIPGPPLYSGAGSSPSKPKPSTSGATSSPVATSQSSPAAAASSSPVSASKAASPSISPPHVNTIYSSTMISAPGSLYSAPPTSSVAEETDASSTQQSTVAPTAQSSTSTMISAPSSLYSAPPTSSVAEETGALSTQQPTVAPTAPSSTSKVQPTSASTFITKVSSAPATYLLTTSETSAPIATKASSGIPCSSREF